MVVFKWKMNFEEKIEEQIRLQLQNRIIKDRRFLDDEQLARLEQFSVLREIFDIDVRDREIKELSCHFAPIFMDGHPINLAIHGKTGTGKTVSTLYFLNMIKELCQKKRIPFFYVHLDCSVPKPCFRALNDLACLLDASKRYKKGISLDELMCKIEEKIKDNQGYFVIFTDEVDHIRRDIDSYLKFLVKRLPQMVKMKIINIFTSNRLDWQEIIDPRIKSFLKLNELLFEPYNALDLRKILSIRVEKAIEAEMLEEGVVEKIAAVASGVHGDARKAVELLSKSAYLAEKSSKKITLDFVDLAVNEIEKDKYVDMIKSAPKQLQASLYSILFIVQRGRSKPISLSDAYVGYQSFCCQYALRSLTQRAFSDFVSELDIYGFLTVKTVSKGRYGRRREILPNIPPDIVKTIMDTVLMNFDEVI